MFPLMESTWINENLLNRVIVMIQFIPKFLIFMIQFSPDTRKLQTLRI